MRARAQLPTDDAKRCRCVNDEIVGLFFLGARAPRFPPKVFRSVRRAPRFPPNAFRMVPKAISAEGLEGLARDGLSARGPPARNRVTIGQLSLPFPKMRRA